ncbi:MAG: DUF6520 family protein [Chryseobacterium culicis]
MKKMRKIALPLAVLLFGAGSAYATTAFKTKTVEMQGYRYDPLAPIGERCKITEKRCQTEIGEVCTWTDVSGTHNLFQDIDGTSCGAQLFEIQ